MKTFVLSHPKISAVISILFIWGMLYLPSLNVNDLSRNEARRITPALTMLKNGDFVTPMLSGKPYYRKPPMMNWLLVGAMQVTGHNNVFIYRFTTVFLVLITALLLLYFPRELIDLKSRFIVSAAFLTSFGFTIGARAAEIDPNYACAAGVAIICWLNFHFSKSSYNWMKWLVPVFPLAYGLLLKGPLILLIYYTLIITILVLEKRSKELLSWQHIISIILFIAPFIFWSSMLKHGTASVASTDGESSGVWLHEMACRFNFNGIDFKTWFRRFLGGFAQFLPWFLTFPLLWNKQLLLRLKDNQITFAKSAKIAVPIIFILIYIMPLAKARYSLPLLVPIVLVASLTLLNLQLNDKWGKIISRIILALSCILVIYSILLFTFLLILRLGFLSINKVSDTIHTFCEVYASTSLPLGICSLLLSLIFGYVIIKNRDNATFKELFTQIVVIVFIMTLALSQFFIYLLPATRSSKHFAKEYAETINAAVPEQETLYGVGFVGEEPFVPYFSTPWCMLDNPTDLKREGHYFLIEEGKLDNLNEYKRTYNLSIIWKRVLYYKKHKYLLIQLGKSENGQK